jgi:hypothetical protein
VNSFLKRLFRRTCRSHDMEPVIFPPPKFECLYDGYLWGATIMVCRHCWQVEVREQRVDTAEEKVYVRQTVLNRGRAQ